MTLSKILILAGLAFFVGIILWLTPTRKPDYKNFRGSGGEDPGPTSDAGGCD